MRVSFYLNDERFVLDLSANILLVEILRGEFGIKSIHSGCRLGYCGSCLVLLNGQAVPSCLVPAFSCRDARIETIEGISTRPDFVDIERGFLKSGLHPCNFCAASKALLTEALLRSETELSPALINAAIPSHWCSCTTGDAFVQAVLTCHEFRRKRVVKASGN